jgi:hypothetical protein
MTVEELRRALRDAPYNQEVRIVLHGRTVSSIAVAAEYTSGGPGTPFNVVAQHPADAAESGASRGIDAHERDVPLQPTSTEVHNRPGPGAQSEPAQRQEQKR